jgi:hypothetical protein
MAAGQCIRSANRGADSWVGPYAACKLRDTRKSQMRVRGSLFDAQGDGGIHA